MREDRSRGLRVELTKSRMRVALSNFSFLKPLKHGITSIAKQCKDLSGLNKTEKHQSGKLG